MQREISLTENVTAGDGNAPDFPDSQPVSDQFALLARTLYELRQETTFCDVILKVCNSEIHAHSCVLAASSNYFSSFLRHDLPRPFCQRTPQIIEIQIDGAELTSYEEAMTCVVDYIYTGELYLSFENVFKVQEISRIMQIDSIFRTCVEFISDLEAEREKKPAILRGSSDKYMSASLHPSILRPQATHSILNPKSRAGNSAQGHKSVMHMKSVSTQVVPKLLGLRESEADMQDAAVNTESTDLKTKVTKRGRHRKEMKPIVVHDKDVEETERIEELLSRKMITVIEASPEDDQEEVPPGVRRSARAAKPRVFEDYEEELPISRKKIKMEDKSLIHLTIEQPFEEPVQDVMQETTEEAAKLEQETSTDSAKTLLGLVAAADEVQKETGEAVIQIEQQMDMAVDMPGISEKEEKPSLSGKEENPLPRAPKVKLDQQYKKKANPGGKFQCQECPYTTNSVKLFGGHMRQHHIDRNQCYYCDLNLDSRAALEEHMATHTGQCKFLCRVCNAVFKVRTQLAIHLPKHSDAKPFICEVCSMGFKWKHALVSHMVVHKNTKDHVCDICGYATAHKHQLNSHQKIHTGETLKCIYTGCTFRALKAQNMKYHLLTHSGERPHQCDVCGQSFSLVKNLKRHMGMHGTRNRKECPKCDFSSTRLDKLKEHLLKAHGIGTPPEKRVTISDMVQESGNPKLVSPNKPHYVIEFESGGITQQLEIQDPEQLLMETSQPDVINAQIAQNIDLGTLEIEGYNEMGSGAITAELSEVQMAEVMVPGESVMAEGLVEEPYEEECIENE